MNRYRAGKSKVAKTPRNAKRKKPTEKELKQMEAGRLKGPDHLTPTQRALIALIVQAQGQDGSATLTKREMAERLGKCEKTVDRLISDLRQRKLLESVPRYTEKAAKSAMRIARPMPRGRSIRYCSNKGTIQLHMV